MRELLEVRGRRRELVRANRKHELDATEETASDAPDKTDNEKSEFESMSDDNIEMQRVGEDVCQQVAVDLRELSSRVRYESDTRTQVREWRQLTDFGGRAPNEIGALYPSRQMSSWNSAFGDLVRKRGLAGQFRSVEDNDEEDDGMDDGIEWDEILQKIDERGDPALPVAGIEFALLALRCKESELLRGLEDVWWIRNRPPVERWYELRTRQFTAELQVRVR
ncbi:MAG: hypothetical protein MHM6MM_002216 [Cercozoa sp. M6MM]